MTMAVVRSVFIASLFPTIWISNFFLLRIYFYFKCWEPYGEVCMLQGMLGEKERRYVLNFTRLSSWKRRFFLKKYFFRKNLSTKCWQIWRQKENSKQMTKKNGEKIPFLVNIKWVILIVNNKNPVKYNWRIPKEARLINVMKIMNCWCNITWNLIGCLMNFFFSTWLIFTFHLSWLINYDEAHQRSHIKYAQTIM